MTARHETIRTPRNRSRHARSPIERLTVAVRWAAALVFVVFGAGKFVNHLSELSSFRSYGLPLPSAFAYAIGVLELVGALMLASGALVRVAGLALAADMLGAIVVSGIARGENISLTLAPALLAAMIFLIRFAGGPHALGAAPDAPSEIAGDD